MFYIIQNNCICKHCKEEVEVKTGQFIGQICLDCQLTDKQCHPVA